MSAIAVFGLGGTIAMASGSAGLTPSHSVAALLPGAAADNLVCEDLAQTASANLTWPLMDYLTLRLREHFAAGGRGAVVVQGTDTVEEAAFIVELLGAGGGPVAFTAAMRGHAAPGADGGANLDAALRVAREGPPDLGVVVVMDDEVHAARRVRKAHTMSTGAFVSGDSGPLGRVEEGRLVLFHPPLGALPRFRMSEIPPPVAIVTLGFDARGEALVAARDPSVRGCVLQAFGAGHAPESLVEGLEDLAKTKPLILCSRCGDGRVAEATYGYPGGEIDLLARGLIGGGRLSAWKARVALQLCLAAPKSDPKSEFRRLVELCA